MNTACRLIVSLILLSTAVSGVALNAAVAPDLGNVITYPSPFNAARGDTAITFDNLTGDVRLRVYKITGESVFDKNMTATLGSISWNAINNDGYSLAPGVYLYYVTNDSGKKATGKVVIIR